MTCRWCRSYLMPLKDSVSQNINDAFGVPKGLPILDFIVMKIHMNLHLWTGQEGTLTESIRVLLSVAQMLNPPMFLIGLNLWTVSNLCPQAATPT